MCNDHVAIIQSSSFVHTELHDIGVGILIYLVEQFTSGNSNCPIESYEATDLSTGITASTFCPVPNSSVSCRQVIIDLSIKGTHVIKFKVKAKGGSE